MGIEKRSLGKLGSPGPFLAEVTNHLDPTFMGGLEVSLIKGLPNNTNNQADTYIVRYCSPFYGVTSVRFEGTNASDFNDVQKSYGFWMVPPDVGTTVMVIFLDGDPNQGYWIGCVPDVFQNHMVPGIAATRKLSITPEQKQKYGTDNLPAAEFLKGISRTVIDPDSITKPIHPFADRLLAQGLLLDTTRGVTTSGARRETPSSVFGISTPGPLDTSPNAKKGRIGYTGDNLQQFPVSRLGGSTFVMDDGDPNGENELVRIRTRTGHQILLHNSQDLIYIANSKGTAWIEMTSNGKLDIYAQDSVSIHTENDFNFRADRDINIEAGRNINMRTINGNMETNISGFYNLVIDDYAKISIKNDKDETIGQNLKLSVGANMNLLATENIKTTASGNIYVKAAGTYNEGATEIHMNSAAVPSAEPADLPPVLSTYSLPNRKTNSGWANGNFYKTDSIKSIMQRVPTHEPWDQHENVNPSTVVPEATDSSLGDRSSSGIPPNPNAAIQPPANPPEVIPGTCDPKYAKDINSPVSQAGISALKDACATLGITSPVAIASVLGIAGGESRWKTVEENFNYSASRLLQVFPSVFKGDQALAQRYAGNPNNTLPEFLYGYTTSKGKGLGNTEPGDGGKFIGRGFIQITGRANYARYGKLLYDKGALDSASYLLNNPKALNDLRTAALASVIYFVDRVKLPQTDPGYFEAACRAVGYNTPDIHATKKGFYECFLGQLTGGILGSGQNGIVTSSDGTPIKTGSGG
jgi:predicted chitinase